MAEVLDLDRIPSISDFKAAGLRRGSSVRLCTKYDPLLTAINMGRLDSVRQAFAEGYNLQGMGECATALHLAYDNGNWDIFKYLVNVQGANVDSPNSRGQTVFHKACHKEDLKMVTELFDMGADVNRPQAEDGFRPVHIAAQKGNYELLLMLVDRGANPAAETEQEDEDGNHPTAVEIARNLGHAKVVEYLEFETDPEMLELKARKDRAMARLAPNAKKIVNNQLTGPMVIQEQKFVMPEITRVPAWSVVANVQGLPVSEFQLMEEFSTIDSDNSGYVTKDEFRALYKMFDNFGAPPEQIDSLLAKYNMLGDDKLSFDEYCVLRLKVAQR